MLEIALSVAAAALSSTAVKEIIGHISKKLVEKGVPKDQIKKLESFERQEPTQLELKEFVSSAHLSLNDGIDIANDALSAAHIVTGNLRSERLRQSKSAFNAALVLVVLGSQYIWGCFPDSV